MLKPSVVFEICLDRYHLAKTLALRTPSLEESVRNRRQRHRGQQAWNYVADFELCGRRRLHGHPGRLELFKLYFCEATPYADSIQILKVKHGTFDYWTQEIKREVGEELMRRGVYPPRRYFRELAATGAQRREALAACDRKTP